MQIRHFFRYGLIIWFLASLAACNANQEGNGPTEFRPTAMKSDSVGVEVPADQNWAIITENQAEEMGLGAWLAKSDGFWTPSEDDILILEEKIGEFLSQNSSLFNYGEPVWERIGKYQRQYIGLQRDGSEIIYGNYFCDNHGKNWRLEWVSVLDGGNCYFQVEYDVQQGDFILLMVNGES